MPSQMLRFSPQLLSISYRLVLFLVRLLVSILESCCPNHAQEFFAIFAIFQHLRLSLHQTKFNRWKYVIYLTVFFFIHSKVKGERKDLLYLMWYA